MHAEVIAIGDELTGGQRLDTNTRWLSQRLADTGVSVLYHTTVGDDLDSIAAVLRAAVERVDLVITTGGLGPTADDLTRQALALAAGRRLSLDPEVLEQIRALFARRGRTMPESNAVQAQFPSGSAPLPNPHGTAPGIHLEVLRSERPPTTVFALPGVPAEMHQMWSESVVPALLRMLGDHRRCVHHRLIRCFGEGESRIESMLPDLVRRGHEPKVGITASQATITLRITAEGATPGECRRTIEPTAATIYECLGDLVFGEGEDRLEDAVVAQLVERNLTLATAEWGTGGVVASWLSAASGGNAAYRGGVVISDLAALEAHWRHDFSHPEGNSLDHEPLVAAMAESAREQLASDLGLAVGPLPSAVESEDDLPHVCFALASPDGVQQWSAPFAAHPAIQRTRTAKQVLNLARIALLKMPSPGPSSSIQGVTRRC